MDCGESKEETPVQVTAENNNNTNKESVVVEAESKPLSKDEKGLKEIMEDDAGDSPLSSESFTEVVTDDEDTLLKDDCDGDDSMTRTASTGPLLKSEQSQLTDAEDIVGDTSGDEDMRSESAETGSYTTPPNDDAECRYMEESDSSFFDMGPLSMCEPTYLEIGSIIDFYKRNTDIQDLSERFHLWKNNEAFRLNGEKFVDRVAHYGYRCMQTAQRAHDRRPTVAEFWNYFMSKTVPRQSWYGTWKVVNNERRGWPLQHKEKAKVLINSVTFSSALAVPTLQIKVIEANGCTEVPEETSEIPLWQIEPTAAGEEFYAEGISIEAGKEALELVRKFYEVYYFVADLEDFKTYFDTTFYERLELIHYLENPAPTAGIMSTTERGKLIAGIKEYHYLRNALQDAGFQSSMQYDMEEVADEDGAQCQGRDAHLLKLHMRLDRHTVELAFLLDQTMRKLVCVMEKVDSEDSTISNADSILVMNNLNVAEFEQLHKWFELYKQNNSMTDDFKVMGSLETALKYCSVGATIFVVSGIYSISGLGNLGEGGRLVGIKLSDTDVTLNTSDEIGDIWMLCSSKSSDFPVQLQNLTINVDAEVDHCMSTCIHVSSGTLKMDSCTIRRMKVLENPENGKGVVPLVRSKNAETIINDCQFINFGNWQ